MTDEEQWEEDYSEVTCDHCGELRRCVLTDDPFVKEGISDSDEGATWWCRPCYSQRADDV